MTPEIQATDELTLFQVYLLPFPIPEAFKTKHKSLSYTSEKWLNLLISTNTVTNVNFIS